MYPIKVVLVDDDQDSLQILQYFMKEVAFFQVVGLGSNGEELIDEVMKKKPDLIITDIRMPKKNGIQAIKDSVSIYPNLKYIFVSAFDHYAVEAFEMEAIDYLVKPVEKVRFLQALEKAKDRIECEKAFVEEHTSQPSMDMLSIKDAACIRFIPQDDIFFIEKIGKKCLVHTKKGRYETNQTLGNLLPRLNSDFYQGHRSYIINLRKIAQISPHHETYIVSFQGYEQVANISKLKISEVKERISIVHEG
ncbi:response regulator transcription factor [Bacillus thermocopriae]|uniref:Response regulator transcription factor n=1 Tax=Neobacillus thermocopriae TaxID=1215031 RepID=A0A6B3TRP5_9BACI|nr:LytTR family DNA-binding domain-containing protein [Neobacillus thermocopriae]NEX79655.1 response regulator transcription factor [Neobacillus thermocopriae]